MSLHAREERAKAQKFEERKIGRGREGEEGVEIVRFGLESRYAPQ